jgi:hypothetical protein
VKKVIDANYFQDPALEGYLRASERNKVVLPDCACMETYKGDPIKNVCRSIRIISRYPKQVILLKSTREIIMLQNSSKTSRRYLEDLDQTKGFRKFCANVERAAQGHSGFEAEIRRFGEEATRHFNSVSQDAVGPVQAIRAIEQSFQREDLHLLRRRKGISHEGRQKIVNDMFVLAGALFRDHLDVRGNPQVSLTPNSLIFRYAVSCYLLVLRWLFAGGASNVSISKLGNDLVDMHYVAYATLFDGLLSRDKKMQAVYRDALFFIEHVFLPSKNNPKARS